MSSKKEPGGGFSRRGFMRGVGLGSGALGTGILTTPAEAAPAAKTLGPGPVQVTLTVNGKAHNLNIEPRVTLIDALRNYLDYTGSKRVCNRGNCGACTVIMDGKAVYACSTLAIDAQGKQIQTIESLTGNGKRDPVIDAFVQNDAQQCGYCTPGFVMSAKAFLQKNPNPTYEQVKQGLGGNLCRCGTYMGVRKAVLAAAKQTKGGANG